MLRPLSRSFPLFMGYILGVMSFQRPELSKLGMTEDELDKGEEFLKAYTRCIYKRDDDDVENNDS